jgi:hypothetical protein
MTGLRVQVTAVKLKPIPFMSARTEVMLALIAVRWRMIGVLLRLPLWRCRLGHE